MEADYCVHCAVHRVCQAKMDHSMDNQQDFNKNPDINDIADKYTVGSRLTRKPTKTKHEFAFYYQWLFVVLSFLTFDYLFANNIIFHFPEDDQFQRYINAAMHMIAFGSILRSRLEFIREEAK